MSTRVDTPPGLSDREPSDLPLDEPALYTNRELSLLEFNRRVLAQAQDTDTPLLERLRFLTICSTNLDEFFEIRAAGLQAQLQQGVDTPGADGLSARQVLQRIVEVAHELVDEQYRVLADELMPALEAEGVHVRFRALWDDEIFAWVRKFFTREVQPVLTPVGLDPAHPFPMILNKSLNFIVELQGKDAFGRNSGLAVVQAPRVLPRLISLPEEVAGGAHHFVSLSGVIQEHVGALFPGMKVTGCHPFRVTRNSDLWVDEEEVDDLLRAVQGELRRRHYAAAVRLEVREDCPFDISGFLLEHFDLDQHDLFRVPGPVNLYRLAALYDLVDRSDLKYAKFVQALPKNWKSNADSHFDRVRSKSILLHHPFQSFGPVAELLREAAHDPDVLAIKCTLYRTGTESPLTDALLDAARNGKEVTVVVELRARFDEAANIDIATRLQNAGARVAYGIVGYKAHAKMLLIVRREGPDVRRYAHLGTGNYHVGNTRSYTDFGLLICDDDLGADIHDLFNQMTGLGKVTKLRKLLQSPFELADRLLALIEAEAELARRGKPAVIRAKVNSLSDRRTIAALYRASQAGVEIDLLVRGVCCLRPGIPGVSDNIRVYSLVGRFLEHSRVYHFGAGGKDVVYCASADLMPRNLYHRVEVAFPVEGDKLKNRILRESFEFYMRDNSQLWELKLGGRYVRREPEAGEAPFRAQEQLLAHYAYRD